VSIWSQVNQAVSEVRAADQAVTDHARQMGRLLKGKLRHLDPSDLVALKRELQDFNGITKKWKRK
jgi:hypothetical protein